MAIWFDGFDMKAVNARLGGSLPGHLGIELLEAGDDFLKARMPVDHRTKQPAGLLHGGASVALAETVASIGAYQCIDRAKFYCVGLEINANHIRSATEGHVFAIARPAHTGRSTHVWEVRITDANDKLVCLSRVTMAIIAREK
jgi:1,4-dihydroxy-2-naphthoyl-CoA hydrolase